MWEEAQPRVCRALAATGARPDEIEDASSEAVARALALGIPFRSPDELSRWLYVVAKNVLIDGARKQRRLVSLPSVPEQRDSYDVGAHVEQRQRLHATASAFARLSGEDQQAIRSAFESSAKLSAIAGTVAVRRHRARVRLREAVGAPAAILVRLRSFLTPASSDGRVVAMASVAAPMVVALLLAPGQHTDRAAPLTTSPMATPAPQARTDETTRPIAITAVSLPGSHAVPVRSVAPHRAPDVVAQSPAPKRRVVDSVAPKEVQETKNRRIQFDRTLPLPDLPIILLPVP